MSERYIYLKNDGGTIQQQMFRCESERLKIIDKWKKLYGKKFSDLTVVEDPEVKKEKYKRKKTGVHDFSDIVFAAKKSTRGFYKSLNGAKD
jgi:hypothetical protein